MKLVFIVLALTTITAHAGSLTEQWEREVAVERQKAADLFLIGADNARLVNASTQIQCGVRPASLSGPVKAMKVTLKDGGVREFLIGEVKGPLWIERKIQVWTLKDGKFTSEWHTIVWGRRFGGWRMELNPSWAKSNPNADRFGNIAEFSFHDVDLHQLNGCRDTQAPVISANPPSTTLTADPSEISASR